MKKLLVIPLFLFVICANAQWQAVDDFEDGDLEGWFLQTNQADTTHTFVVADDPAGGGSKVMIVSPGVNPDKRVVPQIKLPAPVADGETATFYLKVYSFGTSQNTNFGLSDVTGDAVVDFWSAFEIQMFFNEAGIGYRNGSEFIDSGNQFTIETWYELWYVIENNAGVDNDVWSLYVRGGPEFPEQTLIADGIFMRNATTDPISTFAALHYYGSGDSPDGADPQAYDDLYIAPGVNLGTPPDGGGNGGGETWNGFPVVDGIAYTEDFLGAVNVMGDPWIFIFDLNVWAYVPEVGDTGAWVWISK